MLSLLAGVFWALVTGKLVPKSQLEYRETLVDKATASSENWKSAYTDASQQNGVLLGIVSGIVKEETATTRLINTMRDKVGDTPSKEGSS